MPRRWICPEGRARRDGSPWSHVRRCVPEYTHKQNAIGMTWHASMSPPMHTPQKTTKPGYGEDQSTQTGRCRTAPHESSRENRSDVESSIMASLEYVCRAAKYRVLSNKFWRIWFFIREFGSFFWRGARARSLGPQSKGGKIDLATHVTYSRTPCRTTTLVNRAPILTDTLQQRTPRHPEPTRLTPTLQPQSPDTAQHGLTTHTCLHSIGRQRRPHPETRQPAARLRTPPIGELASRPRTRLRAMQIQ